MKKRLFQALTSLRTRTCRKYVTLFIVLISPFLFVNNTRAESSSSPHIQDGKTIVVQATVALFPEFAYSIKKNSSFSLEKAAFALGEEVRVQVKVSGGNDEPLPRHAIRLQAVNAQEETSFTSHGETDIDGLIRFSFVANADFLGSNTLRVTDMTYDVPIPLHQELSFLVYEPTDDQGQREQATKHGIGGDQPFSSGQGTLIGTQTKRGADISQNSGTIVIRNFEGALTRAGP